MPRYVNDGNIKATWCLTVADKAFPALSELAAGVDLECHMTKDGLNITFNENEVDDSALCETYDAKIPGSFGTSVELTMKRRNTVGGDTDEAWDLFATRDQQGTLVVRRGFPAEQAYAADDPVESYPSTTGIRMPVAPATNEQGRFMVKLFGHESPELDGVVVAS